MAHAKRRIIVLLPKLVNFPSTWFATVSFAETRSQLCALISPRKCEVYYNTVGELFIQGLGLGLNSDLSGICSDRIKVHLFSSENCLIVFLSLPKHIRAHPSMSPTQTDLSLILLSSSQFHK